MLVGKKQYGSWKDGSDIYKDSKGYYIVAVNSMNGPEYKKYLKMWKPTSNEGELCLVKKRWTKCKKKKKNKTKRS
jgi:hypothetical protein